MTLFPFADITQRGGTVLPFGKESFCKTNARRVAGADIQTIQLGHGGRAFGLVQDALNAAVPRECSQDADQAQWIDLGASEIRTAMIRARR